MKAFSAQGMGRDEMVGMFSDAGIRTAFANTNVTAWVTDAMSVSEKHNVTGQMRKFMRKQLGTTRFSGLLKSTGLSSAKLEEVILRGMAGLGETGTVQGELDALLKAEGISGADAEEVKRYAATISQQGRLIEANDPGVVNIKATMKSESPEFRKAARDAAKVEIVMRDYITEIVQTKATREELKAQGYTDVKINEIVGDDDLFREEMKERDDKANKMDEFAAEKGISDEEQKKRKNEAAEYRLGTDKLRKVHSTPPPGMKELGDIMGAFLVSMSQEEDIDSATIHTLQESLQKAMGVGREEVRAAVTSKLGIRDKDGTIIGLTEEGKRLAAERGVPEGLMIDSLQKLDVALTQNVKKEEPTPGDDAELKTDDDADATTGGDADAQKVDEEDKDKVAIILTSMEGLINELPVLIANATVNRLIEEESVNVHVVNAEDIKTVVLPIPTDGANV
jgi:hypothetical protein